MSSWQIQDAKARLSEVLEQAQSDGPQFITRHGKERAVVVSVEEYVRLSGHSGKSLIEHLLTGPKVEGFEVVRDRAVGYEFEFDDE